MQFYNIWWASSEATRFTVCAVWGGMGQHGVKRGHAWELRPPLPEPTPFVPLLFRTLRAFGQCVLEKALGVQVPWFFFFSLGKEERTWK